MKVYPGNNERELVALLRQGDTDALTSLYYLYADKLKYYVQRTAKSPFLAEDIVHDTFVKVWENRSQIDPDQSFRPYLFTIAKRKMLNMLKRAQHEHNIVSEIRRHATVQENTTELQLDYNESNALFTEAVDNLSGQAKKVFVLCRLQGLTYKQAAEKLGITESTVNKHMSSALYQIKEYINLRNALCVLLACIAQMP